MNANNSFTGSMQRHPMAAVQSEPFVAAPCFAGAQCGMPMYTATAVVPPVLMQHQFAPRMMSAPHVAPAVRQVAGAGNLFDQLDANRDGTLSRAEFNQYMGIMHRP